MHYRLKTFWPWLLIAMLGPALAAGCTYFPGKRTPRAIAQEPNYRFEDLPTPEKLTLDARESFIFESPSVRAGILVYKGSASYESVIQFFKNEMPKYGWKLVNSFERGDATLFFEKPGWSCIVLVGRFALETTAEIRIGPKEAGEIKSGRKGNP